MAPDQSNPYDFITNPGQPPKRPIIAGPSTPKQRFLMISLLVGGLLVLAIIFWSVLGALTRENFDDVIRVANTQKKLLFVTETALKESTSPSVRSIAATIQASLLSDSAALENYLVKNFSKNAGKQIGSGEDDATQKAFDSAIQTGHFDEEFLKKLDELLGKYKSDVSAATADSKRKSEKDLLGNFSSDAAYFQKIRAS